MIHNLIQLKTKYLLLLVYIVLPLISLIVAFILAYSKINLNGMLPNKAEFNYSFVTFFTMLVSVIIEEILFRNDQSDEKVYKVTHLRIIYILLFLIICRVFAVTNDLFVLFGFLVSVFFYFGALVKYLNTKDIKVVTVIPDKLFYASNITFALIHFNKLEFNFFTSDLRQLYYIIPYLFSLFVFGVIMSIIRNRYKNGLTYTILIHFSLNIFLLFIDFIISKI